MRGAFILALIAGCGGPSSGAREPPEYTGCGADEQWRIFDDSEPKAMIDDTEAPQLTQPAAGMALPYKPKAILQWNQDANDSGAPDGDVLYMDGPGCQACCPQFNLGALTTLHLPPLSGNIYDLQFFIDGSLVHRVVTTLQEWTAPDELWQSWRGKTVSLKLYRAAILVNLLKEGPFIASKASVLDIGS